MKSVQNGKTTYWVYSALTGTPLYQDEVTDNVQTHYLSGGGASVRIRNGVAQYTHSDHLGSPVAASAANASTLWREHYTPFGEKTVDPAGNRNDVGYTGHVQDDASGLTYMQARFYDPVIGRFLSTDPIGYQDQINQYAYVANDPMNATDPTGEEIKEVIPDDYRNAEVEQANALADAAGVSDSSERRSFRDAAMTADQRAANQADDYGTASNGTGVSAVRTANPIASILGADRKFQSDPATPGAETGEVYTGSGGTPKGGTLVCCRKAVVIAVARDTSESNRSATVDSQTGLGQQTANSTNLPVSMTVTTTTNYGRNSATSRFVITPDKED